MKKAKRSARLEFTVTGFSVATGLDHRFLANLVKGTVPTRSKGTARYFDLRQWASLLKDDSATELNKERLGTARAQRRLVEIEVGKAENILINIPDLNKLMNPVFAAMAICVRRSSMTEDEKNMMFQNFREAMAAVPKPNEKPHEQLNTDTQPTNENA